MAASSAKLPVAVQLDEVVEEALEVVEEVRPVGVPRELDLLPDREVARRCRAER
jgi:hypothetical protein